MAQWIKATAAPETVTPANGKTFTLEELQHFVGGYIEVLELSDGTVMYLNEEGKLNELPYKPRSRQDRTSVDRHCLERRHRGRCGDR